MLLGGCGGLALLTRYSSGIPVLTSINQYRPPLPSTFYADDEDRIGEFGEERRLLVAWEKFPKQLIYAFVAAEDDRFFEHGGVDPLGIIRALLKNLQSGRIRAGGSTLTQQVAKSFLFDRMTVRIQPDICRNDRQCDWQERCKTQPGSAFGVCVKREFRSCSQKATIIFQGKPTQIYRGLTTLCDPHEICRPSCQDPEANRSGMCPQWTCTPAAAKPFCQADRDCAFGQVCRDGGCHRDLRKQLADLIHQIIQEGAEIHQITAPAELLANIHGVFRRQTGTNIQISVQNAGSIDAEKLAQIAGVRGVYRFAEKSFRRKIREAILAIRLERQFSKAQILWLYLNHVYLGHQAYGVQAAAQNYFGKNVWELNLAESATIAGLPQAPSAYDPYRHPQRARTRMLYVLRRMSELNYITKEQMEEALQFPLQTQARSELFAAKVPGFTAEVRRDIQRRYGQDRMLKDGLHIFTTVDAEKQMIARRQLRESLEQLDMRQGYRGPIGIIKRKHWDEAIKQATAFYGDAPLKRGTVYAGLVTQIDRLRQRAQVQVGRHKGWLPIAAMTWAGRFIPGRSFHRPRLQRIEHALKVGYWIFVEPIDPKTLRSGNRRQDANLSQDGLVFSLRQSPKVEGAILSLDPHSGYVEAMVGGYSYERSQFNRALYACRQPGSSFKPIVYATAFEVGEEFEKGGKREEIPITPGTIILDSPLVHDSGTDPNAARYKPSNYTGKYEGPVTAYHALVQSKNIPAIKMMLKISIDKVIQFARRFGISTLMRKELGLALGQSCVRPWDLTLFYAMLARDGLRPNPTFLKMILDRDGRVIEDQRSYDDPTLSPESRFNRIEHTIFRQEERLLSRETAYLITYILRRVVTSGTGYKVNRLAKPAAGKTGTTNDSFDVWFTGYTPLHATTVWLGFDKNEQPLGGWETGGNTAAPVWLSYMQQATQGQTWPEWQPPPDITWHRISSTTGNIANVDTPDAIRLPFRKGTEPQQRTERRGRVSADGFYSSDY
jgi:penicillin-binding protein 1A